MESGKFKAEFFWGLHPDEALIHVGWKAVMTNEGTLLCGHCQRDNEMAVVNVSGPLGRDLTLEQLTSVIQNVGGLLSLETSGKIPPNMSYQEGPFALWRTMTYPLHGDPKPGWWLGFGDSAHQVGRMEVEAWLTEAEAWEEVVRRQGWPAIRGEYTEERAPSWLLDMQETYKPEGGDSITAT